MYLDTSGRSKDGKLGGDGRVGKVGKGGRLGKLGKLANVGSVGRCGKLSRFIYSDNFGRLRRPIWSKSSSKESTSLA